MGSPVPEGSVRPLRILMATEYLPPYVSGIANRCKYLIRGYREEGHLVTVYGPVGTDCDKIAPSVRNIFYPAQRMFIFPPLDLLFQLIDITTPVPYDIAHIVGPLAFPFIPIMFLLWLRGVKVYVSYHVALQKYKNLYLGEWQFLGDILEFGYILVYYYPLVMFATVVGIPSGAADTFIFKLSNRIHFMKSGLDTDVYVPRANVLTDGEVSDAPSLLPQPSDPATIGSPVSTPKISRKRSHELATHRLSMSVPSSSSSMSVQSSASSENRGPHLVYVGRLAVEKNVQFLIEALNHPLLSNATLTIVGDGPWRRNLEDLARDTVGSHEVYSGPVMGEDPTHVLKTQHVSAAVLNSKKRVTFAGMIIDERTVARFYSNADVFVSASSSETFGFTVVEAMACGTPAVVVRSGSFPKVFGMINEWMFDEENTEDYARKVARVWSDGNVARKVARRIAVNDFSIKSSVKDLLRTYRLIVDGKEDELDKALKSKQL
ncbi:hypothetical protein BJ742DRAFT_744714 [Cladochytrium replicatum]|nr:hypothetical protein BJ742DRAFT_744714 [Cladochytrium replicatum]